jgi:hypothetical protein
MVWERSGDTYYASPLGPNDEPLFHMIIEQLPDGMWDWTVWPPGGNPGQAMRGVALSVQDAMNQAEKSIAP